MPHLTDTRISSAVDPVATLDAIAADELLVIAEAARRDRQVDRARSAYTVATAEAEARLAVNRTRLNAYIMANQDEFRKPRARKTPKGSFGLRTVSNVAVDDEPAVIAWADDNGYTDVVTREPKISKSAIRARLDAGESVPGVALEQGDVSFYRLAKSLVDAAKKGA